MVQVTTTFVFSARLPLSSQAAQAVIDGRNPQDSPSLIIAGPLHPRAGIAMGVAGQLNVTQRGRVRSGARQGGARYRIPPGLSRSRPVNPIGVTRTGRHILRGRPDNQAVLLQLRLDSK